MLGEAAISEDRIGEDVVESGDGLGGVEQLGKAAFHFLVQITGALGELEVLEGLLLDGAEEENTPVFPRSGGGSLAHVVDVVRLVLLKEAADVKEGLGNAAELPEQQGD